MRRAKRILGVVVFLAIGLVLTVLTSYLLRPTGNGRPRVIGIYGEKEDSLDILGIGSSALYRYMDSPVLYSEQGYTSYMLASPGQPAYLVPEMIDEVLRTQSPQLLILETRKFVLWNGDKIKENRFRQVVDNLKYSSSRFAMINKVKDKLQDPLLSYYFDIMMYHENWENLSEDSFKYMFNEYKSLKKGWANVAKHSVQPQPDIADVKKESPINKNAEKALLEIMDKCEENGIQILFVESPYVISKGEQRKVNYMKRLVEEHGYHFLDGNKLVGEIGIDYNVDFYNQDHVNPIGARKFTKYVGEYIRQNYSIDTSLSGEITEEWERAIALDNAEYMECAEAIMADVKK